MIIAALMIVRDEEALIGLNIQYHLALGFDYIFVMDHCSVDCTGSILNGFAQDTRIVVIKEVDPVFDHGRMANQLLQFALGLHRIDWFFLIDADEFLGVENKVHDFVRSLEQKNIVYASIGWVNALSKEQENVSNAIGATTFYYPFPERSWQHEGHFRKAIAKNHQDIEIVVGGHYFRSQNDPAFYGRSGGKPYLVPFTEARYYHFELRESAQNLYKKWKKLALYEKDSSTTSDKPWLERLALIRDYVARYEHNMEALSEQWFNANSTLWGTEIPAARIFTDHHLQNWSRSHVDQQEGTHE